MDLKLQNDIELGWGTPIFAISWPESASLNTDLKALILEQRSKHEGLQRSNQGGWHSTEDLLSWSSPHMKTLQKRIIEAFRRATTRTGKGQGYNGKMQITAWANVNKHGDSNDVHNHPHCAWSGVYYVDVGQGRQSGGQGGGGAIYFPDPRGGAGMMPDYFTVFGQAREIHPENSLMLLFPSWLMHGVRRYSGDSQRISIAFNIALLDLI